MHTLNSAILFGGQAFDPQESRPFNIETCRLTCRLAKAFELPIRNINLLSCDSSNEMQVIFLLYNYLRWRDETEQPPRIALVAGQSVAQILALHYAGILNDECLVEILIKRTKALNKYVRPDTGIISIVGFEEADIGRLTDLASQCGAYISNYNAKNSITISGNNKTLKEIRTKVSQLKLGFCKILNVQGGWHSPFVEVPKQLSFMDILRNSENAKNKMAVIDNTTLIKLTNSDPLEIINELILRGMFSPVRWFETLSMIDNTNAIDTIYFGGGFSMIEKLSKHSIIKTRTVRI